MGTQKRMYLCNDAELSKTSTPNCAPSFTIAKDAAQIQIKLRGRGTFLDIKLPATIIGGRRRTRVTHPPSCVTRFDTRVMIDDISCTLSPQSHCSWQVGLFVQALDLYAFLLRELVPCVAQSLRRASRALIAPWDDPKIRVFSEIERSSTTRR
jgi:hypothetical protein